MQYLLLLGNVFYKNDGDCDWFPVWLLIHLEKEGKFYLTFSEESARLSDIRTKNKRKSTNKKSTVKRFFTESRRVWEMPGERFTVAGAVSSRYRGRISRRMPPYQKSSYRMGGWNFPILEDSFFCIWNRRKQWRTDRCTGSRAVWRRRVAPRDTRPWWISSKVLRRLIRGVF